MIDEATTREPALPFLDKREWTTAEALEWALQRIRTSLDCGTYYDKAAAALNEHIASRRHDD